MPNTFDRPARQAGIPAMTSRFQRIRRIPTEALVVILGWWAAFSYARWAAQALTGRTDWSFAAGSVVELLALCVAFVLIGAALDAASPWLAGPLLTRRARYLIGVAIASATAVSIGSYHHTLFQVSLSAVVTAAVTKIVCVIAIALVMLRYWDGRLVAAGAQSQQNPESKAMLIALVAVVLVLAFVPPKAPEPPGPDAFDEHNVQRAAGRYEITWGYDFFETGALVTRETACSIDGRSVSFDDIQSALRDSDKYAVATVGDRGVVRSVTLDTRQTGDEWSDVGPGDGPDAEVAGE